MTFAVLLVCTGNLCRSVAAQQLLSAVVPARAIELMSAGTHAQPGLPAHPLTVKALAHAGVPPFVHSSQPLVPEAVRIADLILTATRDHRLKVVDADSTAVRRTFTVLEFARLAGSMTETVGSLVDLRDSVAERRGMAASTAADDLGDPVQGEARDHAAMVQVLVPAIQRIAAAMSGVASI